MKIRHTVDAPKIEDIKQRIINNKWTPTVVMVAAVVVAIRVSSKEATVVINNY